MFASLTSRRTQGVIRRHAALATHADIQKVMSTGVQFSTTAGVLRRLWVLLDVSEANMSGVEAKSRQMQRDAYEQIEASRSSPEDGGKLERVYKVRTVVNRITVDSPLGT